mgnify:CR=1 FL=1
MYLTSTTNQKNLPRYFSQVFEMAATMNTGILDFVLPDGRVFRANGKNPGPVAQVDIHNPEVFARLIREGDLGFSDAYLDSWWSTPDLQSFMDWVHAENDELYDGFPGMSLVRTFEKIRFWLQSNSKRQARKNISHHYDLGNDFYRLWLDNTMTYSSALFTTGQEDLEAAQIAKYASMVDQMGVKEGDHVLEIGCGWGGFAEYAAKERGLKVTGLTISKEQLEFFKNIHWLIENKFIDVNIAYQEKSQKELEYEVFLFNQYLRKIANNINDERRYIEYSNPSNEVIKKFLRDYAKWNFEQQANISSKLFPDPTDEVIDEVYHVKYKIFIKKVF